MNGFKGQYLPAHAVAFYKSFEKAGLSKDQIRNLIQNPGLIKEALALIQTAEKKPLPSKKKKKKTKQKKRKKKKEASEYKLIDPKPLAGDRVRLAGVDDQFAFWVGLFPDLDPTSTLEVWSGELSGKDVEYAVIPHDLRAETVFARAEGFQSEATNCCEILLSGLDYWRTYNRDIVGEGIHFVVAPVQFYVFTSKSSNAGGIKVRPSGYMWLDQGVANAFRHETPANLALTDALCVLMTCLDRVAGDRSCRISFSRVLGCEAAGYSTQWSSEAKKFWHDDWCFG